MFRIVLAVITIVVGSIAAYAQIVNPTAPSPPGGNPPQLQFNTSGVFGGISGVTSDNANVGFATSSQLILYGQTAGNCLTVNSSFAVISQSCSAGSQTSIAAGSNITTAGTAGNVTVNVVATPSFTTVIASGNVTAGTAQFTGLLTGTNAVFQTVTVNNLTPTGPNCLQETGGVLQATNVGCATQTATPSIAAGSNITTSGSAANTTINVVATPSFTTVIASGNLTAATAQFAGFLTAGGASLAGLTIQTETLSGNLTGTSANFSGNLTGTTAQFTGQLTGTSAVFQTVTVSNLTPTGPNCLQETGGVLQATNAACASPTATSIAAGTNITTSGTASNITINVVATPSFTTVIATGNLTAGGAQFTSQVTGTSAVFQTATISNLTPTGPNCLQETGGVLQATNVSCATQVATISIAAGNNITTSGTTSNITVTATPTGASNTVQFNNAGVFGGDAGFQYAGGTSGIVTHTLGPGNLTTTNSRALSIIGTLSSGTVQFGAPLFMNITTNAFASGTKLVDLQASGISYLSLFASSGMTVLGNITGTTAQVTGWLTGPGANFQTATIAGALIGSTGNFSSNLTASTVMGVVGWLTAPGVNMQTATLAGNLIGTNATFSGNLTANIAQFAGFLSAGGSSLSGLTIQTETLTGALNGSTGNFTSNLTGQIGAFPGFLTATGTNFFTSTISQVTATTAFATSVVGNAGTNSEGSISFLTNNVVQFGDGGLNANGYYNWGGEGRTSADSQGFISTGVVNLISLNVKAGRTYKFIGEAPIKAATAATGGITFRIGGGAIATNVVYDGWLVDHGQGGSAGIKGSTQATALSTGVASSTITGTTGHATVVGTISVSGAGTLILQAAGFSTVTAASAVTVGRGATFIVEDMP